VVGVQQSGGVGSPVMEVDDPPRQVGAQTACHGRIGGGLNPGFGACRGQPVAQTLGAGRGDEEFRQRAVVGGCQVEQRPFAPAEGPRTGGDDAALALHYCSDADDHHWQLV